IQGYVEPLEEGWWYISAHLSGAEHFILQMENETGQMIPVSPGRQDPIFLPATQRNLSLAAIFPQDWDGPATGTITISQADAENTYRIPIEFWVPEPEPPEDTTGQALLFIFAATIIILLVAGILLKKQLGPGG
ncbi:MAG: hypothetical protein QCI38_05335, partial [Candidatus Thermoplasmatota archaeon]|nr:hypothetical protein [Candidatus Thermoplasmatota archaeon]